MKSFLFPKFVLETILVSAVAVFVLTANLFAEEAAGRTVWNAVEYGAAPDGATDCTEAIQNALNDAFEAGGGTVSLPAGRFAVRGNLSVPRGVTLEGTYRSALTIDHIDQKVDGTILLAYAGRGSNEGPAFITLAGTPPTTMRAGTSLVTTAPAATTLPSPMVTPGQSWASRSGCP